MSQEKTNFVVHICNGVNTVFHESADIPRNGVVVPIHRGEEEMLVKEHNVNRLTFDGSKIVLMKEARKVEKLDYTKWIEVLIFIAGAITGAGFVINF